MMSECVDNKERVPSRKQTKPDSIVLSDAEVRGLLRSDKDRPRMGFTTILLLGVLLFVSVVKLAALHGLMLLPHAATEFAVKGAAYLLRLYCAGVE